MYIYLGSYLYSSTVYTIHNLELGVGTQRGSSMVSHTLKLGVGMQRGSLMVSNWVWGIRQSRTGCGGGGVPQSSKSFLTVQLKSVVVISIITFLNFKPGGAPSLVYDNDRARDELEWPSNRVLPN